MDTEKEIDRLNKRLRKLQIKNEQLEADNYVIKRLNDCLLTFMDAKVPKYALKEIARHGRTGNSGFCYCADSMEDE